MRKYVMIAPVLCAISAIAFGQVTVDCPEDKCTHIVSVFKGEGGLIAEVDGDEMATWVATCDGVFRTGELTPNEDGVVGMIFDMNNGLACDADGGSFELGPVKDGGWYWITDEPSSASGNLLAKDVLANTETTLTDAGPGVEKTPGRGATLLRETSTGRMGILPTILPKAAASEVDVRKCGYSGAGTSTDPYERVVSECALGDGGAVILAMWRDDFTGERIRVMDGGTIIRPAGGGARRLQFDLWGNGSGHFVTAASATDNGIVLGQLDIGLTAPHGEALRSAAVLKGVTMSVSHGSGPSAGQIGNNATVGGVSWSATSQGGDLDIGSDTSHCSDTDDFDMPITVSAAVTDEGAAAVTPAISRKDDGEAATISFTIVCPP